MRTNKTQLLECLFDLLADHNISLREFVVAFYRSRVRNKEYQDTFIQNIETDIKGIYVADSRDMHEDLFKVMEEGK